MKKNIKKNIMTVKLDLGERRNGYSILIQKVNGERTCGVPIWIDDEDFTSNDALRSRVGEMAIFGFDKIQKDHPIFANKNKKDD